MLSKEMEDGSTEGVHPDELTFEERESFSSSTPMKAIRSFCVECSGGSVYEVTKCISSACPLWIYRMGSVPYNSYEHKMDRFKRGLGPEPTKRKLNVK